MQSSEQPRRPIRVLHLLPHLSQGGAEATLTSLTNCILPGIEQSVCTLMPGPHHFTVEVPLYCGPAERDRWDFFRVLPWLNSVIADVQPDIIHSWMYHCNFLSMLVVRKNIKLIWSVHHESPATIEKHSTRMLSRICAAMSHRFPSRIAYVAEAARETHENAGYDSSKGAVVANGIDLNRFNLSHLAQRQASDRIRVGLIGRLDPVKGHAFLIDVIAKHPLRKKIDLLFVGAGCDQSQDLVDQLKAARLLGQTQLMGVQERIEDIYATLDVLAIPSFSEALPLVALEASAMGIPVIASMVGDLPNLGFDDDLMFAPSDAEGCAAALTMAVKRLSDPNFPARQRRQVAERFSQNRMASEYSLIYNQVLASA